ncbi:MAG: hypothetical protein HXX16_03930 [Bacteroidales bacterium]|nr:hypothetical protein [Bacteroidales bacterium]
MINVKEIVDFWNAEQPKYENLGKIVNDFIKNKITDYEILPEIHYRTKELLSIIKKVKKKQAQKEYSYQNINDKLGIRIICTFQEELEIIDTFLKNNFVIKNVEYKQENIDFNKLDYVSNHYDVTINCSIKEFKKQNELENLVFEIQVRTLNQHAWSNTAHSLSYKQETDLPNKLKRKVYRLLSLYELADDEFSAVNEALKSYQDNPIYNLLKKIEGKFYKFARFDYDKETSLKDINTILSYFETDKAKQELINNIESFVTNSEVKIQKIYDENRSRFHEILLLTQPEIFIIWYMLQNNSFTIEDNWQNDFDADDLEQVKILWGNEL